MTWISGWRIDGFGHFRDVEVRDLPRGLVVFHGPNEAGKSTLLGFLRAVLFGQPARRKEPRYPPLKGGRWGGEVFLETPEGTVTVERWLEGRRQPRVVLEDGTVLGAHDFRRLLGGADERLFRSVFAIGLSELQAFTALDAAGVRDRLFSAAVLGAGRSARRIEETLEARREELLGARGGGRIEELERRLARLGAELDAARRREAGYPALVAEEERLRAALRELDEATTAARRSEKRHDTLLALWPVECERAEAERERSELPSLAAFPAEAPRRYAEIVAESAAALEDVERRQATRASAASRVVEARAALDDAATLVATEAEALHAELPRYREQLERRTAAEMAHAKAEAQAHEALRSLGDGWTAERVLAAGRPAALREQAREWEETLRSARARAAVAQEEEEAAASVATEAGERERDAKRRLGGEPPFDDAALDRDEERIARIRAGLDEVRAAEAAIREVRGRLVERELGLKQDEATRVAVLPAWVWTVVGTAALVAFILALVGWIRGDVLGAWLLAVVGMIAAVGSALLWRSSVHDEEARRNHEQDVQLRRTAIGPERERLAHRERAARQLAERLCAEAGLLGMEGLPAEPELAAREGEIAARREAIADWRDQQAATALEAERLEAEAARLAQQRGRVSFQRFDLQRVMKETEARWAAWAKELGAPAGGTPAQALDFLDAVQRARAAVRQRDRVAARVGPIGAEAAEWESRARALLARAGDATEPEAVAAEALPGAVAALVARCRKDAPVRERLRELEVLLEAASAALSAAEARQARAESERQALVRSAGVADEEAFRAGLRAWQRRDALDATIRRLSRELDAQLGTGEEATSLKEELRTGRRDEWEAARTAAASEAEALAGRRDEAVREHLDAERAREQLEQSSDVAGIETERQALLTRLAEAKREWSVATVAGALVRDALSEYERTRQPKVLALAARLFESVTDGRYTRIVQEAEGKELVALTHAGERRHTAEMSRGTAEQLYLSLRLALAAEFAARNVPLPIILDDVLVNFDPGRARATAAALARKAEDQQVMLFTSQPTTVEMLLELAPNAVVHRLARQDEPGDAGDTEAPEVVRPLEAEPAAGSRWARARKPRGPAGSRRTPLDG